MDDGYGAEDEDQLVQMVQEFIESSDSSSNNAFFSPHHHNLHPNYFALSDIVESETELEAELLDSVMRHMRKMNNCHTSESSGVKRWLVKKLQMDGYRASLCHSCWVSSLGCPGGDYEYVDVMVKNDKHSSSSSSSSSSRRLIVDVDFKSQFELARPTAAYRQLVEILPCVFVGDERKLDGIVSLVCSAAKQSLVDRGLHVPPWRTTAYMMSKWHRPSSTSTVLPSSDVDADYSMDIRKLGGGSSGFPA